MVSSTDSGGVRCRVEHSSTAPPSVVFDVLMDVQRWHEWAPAVTTVSWDRAGDPETGVGGVRRVSSGAEVYRDRVVVSARPYQHAYVTGLPENWPYTDLNTDVRINEDPAGSSIVWSATCVARHPALANSIEAKLAFVHARWCAALADEAARRHRLACDAAPDEAVDQIA